MYQSLLSTIHCINPKCLKPTHQPWGNKFCQSCGAPLELNRRYIPLDYLGTGGFSTLYTVWDLKTQTEKVLKVLLDSSPKVLELFGQEAAVLARLRHPGIPRVEADGYFFLRKRNASAAPVPCLVMEKIHGPTLEQILVQYPLGCPEPWVMNWLNQALDILRDLHGHQIIHRDLKPSNLMLRSAPTFPLDSIQIRQHQLVMIDFGGARQVGGEPEHPESPRSSTRLVSPGYSPPEQIVGARVNPATDFYALGRTCIHLLTGVFPGDLEDTTTAELVWRDRVTVSPRFAHLLDQMVRFENALRPQTALEIQTILFHIVRQNRHPRRHMSVLELSWDVIKTGLIQLDYGLTVLSEWTGRLSLSLLKATLETIWEMGLGGIGGVIGATSGLMLIYFTPLDESVAQAVTEQFSRWTFRSSEGFVSQLGSGILVSGLAGLGTAVGLTDAGGFNQDRRYGFAAVLGTLGYGVGSVTSKLALIVGENSGFPEFSRLGNLSLGLAAALVTLGLGFPSHQAVYVFITAVGVAGIFWGLGLDSSFPEVALRFPMVSSPLEWETFWLSLAFTGILGCAIGLCLGVSHYLIIPILRWLGWRY